MENGTSPTAMPDELNRGYSNSFMDTLLQRAGHSRPDAPALSQAQLAAMDQQAQS